MLFAARERAGFEAAGIPELRLAGLETEAVAELLTDRVGRDVSLAVAARLREATAGNPLALTGLTDLLSPAQMEGTEPLEDPLPIGDDVELAFGQRILSLPGRSQRALAVAAADPAIPLTSLEEALRELGLDPSALEPAEREGLVSTTVAGVEFRHPLVRSVAYRQTAGPELRRVHRALANALEQTDDRGRRALHLARAATGPDESVARELVGIARSARGRVAPEPAARMLETAARITAGRELRVERLLEAAQTFGRAARLEPARRLLDEVLGDAPDDPCLRADVQRLRARLETVSGGHHYIHELLVDEAERVLQLDPNRGALLLADAAFLAVIDGELRLSLDLATRARSLGTHLDRLAEFEVQQSLGGALVLAGRIDEGLEHLEQAEELLTREHTDLDPMAWALAQAYHWAERYEHAREMIGSIVQRARREGAAGALPTALVVMSWLDFRLGDWTRAYAEATESLSLSAATEQRPSRAFGLMRLAELEAGRGAAGDCRTHVKEALELADEVGVGSMQLMAAPILGLLALGCGPTEHTIEQLESAGAGVPPPRSRGADGPAVDPGADRGLRWPRGSRRSGADIGGARASLDALRAGQRGGGGLALSRPSLRGRGRGRPVVPPRARVA